jgi:uncharacterized protein
VKGSRFNLLVPTDSSSGDVVLFNTLYGSMSVLSKSEQASAEVLLSGGASEECSAELHKELLAQKHLVPDDLDELALVRARKRAGIRDGNTLDVIILPTLDCNFRCVYCYEEHRSSRMRPETIASVKKWLAAIIPGHKLVMLSWFGGEPLMHFDAVISISEHAKRVAEQSGVLTVLHITTNGYALSAKRSKALVSAGIRDFQITVDGTARAHDRLRVLRNGRGTFGRVFRNVCALAASHPDVKISLRINFNHTNIDDIPNLLEAFPAAIRPQLRVCFEPIFGDVPISATGNISATEISDKLSRFSARAAALGYDIVYGVSAIHPGKLVYCYAEREHQYIINFDGGVFKCSVCNFDADHRVGQLQPDGSVDRIEREWAKWVSDELFGPQCDACVYLPLCMGGCRKTRMSAERGKDCALVATNASYVLKQVAFGGLKNAFQMCGRH